MLKKLLDSLERRLGRMGGINNLMTWIVLIMGGVYVADLVLAPSMGISLSSYLVFSKEAILRGQIWRLVTFIFLPPTSSLLFIIIQLLFYNFLGNMLQSHWGRLRFNLFYFTGMIFNIIAGMITGYATSYYLNLSLFLAVALLYPEMQINIYGILPIRMKWLALVDVLLLLPGLLTGTWGMRVAIVLSLANVLLFFYDRFLQQFKEARRRYEWKKNWRNAKWR